MRMIRLRFSYITFYVLVACMILLFSCEKDKNIIPLIVPPTISEFTLRDTLKIEPEYQVGPFADLFNRYNDKFYGVNSSNRVGFSVQKMGSNSEFSFVDSSAANLFPSILITLKNTEFESLAAEYNLANTSIVTVKNSQTFIDGSSSISNQTNVINGILKIKYNNSLKTVNGEISSLKIPLGYFTPEDISPLTRSSNGILIEHGGSTRTVSLKFTDVKIR